MNIQSYQILVWHMCSGLAEAVLFAIQGVHTLHYYNSLTNCDAGMNYCFGTVLIQIFSDTAEVIYHVIR